MRANTEVLVLIQFMMLGIITKGSDVNNDEGQYSYGQGTNQKGEITYEYTYDNNQPDPKPIEYQCYSCTFQIRNGMSAGFDNCRDPFIPDNMQLQTCAGPCAKIYHKTSDTEYTISRTCLPKCRDIQDEKGYTQCCTGNLCNGSNTLSLSTYSVLLLSFGLVASILTVL